MLSALAGSKASLSKREEIWVGSEKKGILLLSDLLGKGFIFKALGQAWITISC